MDVATIKRYLENQIGDINKELKNIYLPHEAVLILLGKRTAFAMTLEFIDSLQQEQKPAEWSEDERIRKWLIDYFKNVGNTWIHREISPEQILSYLEKQKDHFRDDTKMVEQKPAEWSEEDNIGWEEAFACVTRTEKAAKNEEELQNAVTAEKWLKEIKFKYYVHPIKQEWSEEDEKKINFLSRLIEFQVKDDEYCFGDGRLISKQEAIEMLKSLRPSWKPSEEELVALKRVGSILRDYGHSELAKTVFMIEGKLANFN